MTKPAETQEQSTGSTAIKNQPASEKRTGTTGKGRKHRRPPYRALAVSFCVTTALLIYGLLYIDTIVPPVLTTKLLFPLSRLMAFILIGLVLGQIIESTGWTRHLAILAGPLFRFSNLGARCSAAFTTAFLSGVASNAMLFGYYQDGHINRRQLYLANFINHFPGYFLHLPTTFFIVVPLTGKAGLIYFAITFTATLLRTGLFLLFGRFFLTPLPQEGGEPEDTEERTTKKKQSLVTTIRKKIPTRLTTVAVWVLPIYTAVFLLTQLGMFARANELLSSFFVTGFVPVEALSVVILSFAAEFTSGFAAAGAMLDAGVITVKQTVVALITGNILAFPLRALRHQLPRYIGIFAPKMGTQILLMGQFFRIASLTAVTMAYYYLF